MLSFSNDTYGIKNNAVSEDTSKTLKVWKSMAMVRPWSIAFSKKYVYTYNIKKSFQENLFGGIWHKNINNVAHTVRWCNTNSTLKVCAKSMLCSCCKIHAINKCTFSILLKYSDTRHPHHSGVLRVRQSNNREALSSTYQNVCL